MTPFDAAYWEDEYQKWLERKRQWDALILLAFVIIGFAMGKFS